MSTPNQISIVIPQAIIDEVTQKINECKTALAPYLQGLTAEERHDLFKMGNKSVATVQKIKSYTQTNPEFIPNFMDVEEFSKDEAVVTALNPIANLATQLASDLSDTVMLAGSEAMQSALQYYGQVNLANKQGVTTARPVYEDLKARFSRRSNRNNTTNP